MARGWGKGARSAGRRPLPLRHPRTCGTRRLGCFSAPCWGIVRLLSHQCGEQVLLQVLSAGTQDFHHRFVCVCLQAPVKPLRSCFAEVSVPCGFPLHLTGGVSLSGYDEVGASLERHCDLDLRCVIGRIADSGDSGFQTRRFEGGEDVVWRKWFDLHTYRQGYALSALCWIGIEILRTWSGKQGR